jgi:hypothetical protein
LPECETLLYDPKPTTTGQLNPKVATVYWSDETLTQHYAQQLTKLELTQTLVAGHNHWIGNVPSGVALSNSRSGMGAQFCSPATALCRSSPRARKGERNSRLNDSISGKR